MNNARVGHLFCFGLGYTAMALARQVLAEGWAVAGTCRDRDKASALRDHGIEAHIFDGTAPIQDAAAALDGVTHILASIPPDAEGDPAARLHGGEIGALPSLRWVGYLSTTGVYGDAAGGWVDETTPLAPSGDRGARRVRAEQDWGDLMQRHGTPVHRFRLAGIYGPGRSAIDSVRAGRARRVDKPGQVFNRIHVDDIVQVLRASMADPEPGAAYNLADDAPSPSHEVTAFACDLLGVKPPPLEPYDPGTMSEMARGFYRDNKRIDNRRIKERLGVTLRYPSYREGLRAQMDGT